MQQSAYIIEKAGKSQDVDAMESETEELEKQFRLLQEQLEDEQKCIDRNDVNPASEDFEERRDRKGE